MYWSIMPVLACMARSKRSASMRLATSLRSISSARHISRNYCFPRCAPAVADIFINISSMGGKMYSVLGGMVPPPPNMRLVGGQTACGWKLPTSASRWLSSNTGIETGFGDAPVKVLSNVRPGTVWSVGKGVALSIQKNVR